MIDVGYKAVITENKLPQYIRHLHVGAAEAVAKTADSVETGAKRRVPVRTGYLRSTIIVRTRPDRISLRAVVYVGGYYGLYVERGTRFMAPRPYLQPAAEASWYRYQQLMRGVVNRIR